MQYWGGGGGGEEGDQTPCQKVNISIGNSCKNYCNLEYKFSNLWETQLIMARSFFSRIYHNIGKLNALKVYTNTSVPIQVFNLFPCNLLPTYSVHNLKFASFPHHLMPSGFTHMYTPHTSIPPPDHTSPQLLVQEVM